MPYAPSWSECRPTVGATVRYLGERHASFDESITYPQYILPDYAAVDLRAGLQVGSFNTQLYIHNLLDKRGQLSIIYPQFGPRVAITQPRTIGVQVSTRF